MSSISKTNKTKLIISILTWILYIFWLLKMSSTDLTLTNFLTHLIFIVILVFLYKNDLKKNYKALKDKKNKSVRKIFIFTLILFGILILSNITISIISNVMGSSFDADSSSKAIYKLFSIVPFGTMFVMFLTMFFYPIVEELVFRKSIFDVIKSPILFIIISSLITWYFQVTITSPHIPEFILALSVLFNSIFSAIILVKHKNILYTIIPRMIYNLIICGIQIITLFVK